MKNKYYLVLVIFASVIAVLWVISRPVSTQIQESENITTQQVTNMDAKSKKMVEDRLAQNQKKLAEVMSETQFVNKNNLLFAIAADQRVLGDYSAAKKNLEQAMNNNPNDPYMMTTYASLLNMMGYKKATMEYMDKSLKLLADNEDSWLFKIDLMQKFGYSSKEIEEAFQHGLNALTTKVNLTLRYVEYLKTTRQYGAAYMALNELITQKKIDGANYSQELVDLKAQM